MSTAIANWCLHCGLQLPEHAEFCPECGSPVEVAIRVDREVKLTRTTITNGCLYCGLQLPDSVHFCPECGRPIERRRITDETQESVAGRSETWIEGKGDLVRQR